MRRRPILLILLAIVVIALVVVIIVLNLKPAANVPTGYISYKDQNDFSFNHPSTWEMAEVEVDGKRNILFREGNEEVMTLITPYQNIAFETHGIEKTNIVQTNNAGTTLRYDLLTPLIPIEKEMAVITWKKGCLQTALAGCDDIVASDSGIIIMNLSANQNTRAQQLTIIDEINRSFRIY